MESTSTHMNRLGKSLVTDSELLSFEAIVAEVDAVEARSVRRAGRRAARTRAPLGGGHRPDEERFLEAVERVTPTLARAA